jgi:FKBP-type peptidyl-prolyl cis-trans isomerase 2
MFRALTTAALVVALLSGCFGLPEGAADTGDLVTIRYDAIDAETGQALHSNRSATFDVGSGASRLGLGLERAVRGHLPGDAFTVTIEDDPTLAFDGTVEVNRTLAPVPIHQTAPADDFRQYVGEPTVGTTFPAYGIYTGRVTGSNATVVEFDVLAEDGQEDPVPSVGAVLLTRVGATTLTRELVPVEGSTFTINPPSPFQPTTPLGLEPGSYRVEGAEGDKIVFSHGQADAQLIGKTLRFDVTVVSVSAGQDVVPTSGNFGVRNSPQVNGDPRAVLEQPLPAGEPPADDHSTH